jgi:urease accessory protein
MTIVDDPTRTLCLLQLTDSGFPTGAFSFSQGLEGLVAAEMLSGEDDVAAVVAAHLDDGFAGVECPAMAQAWRAAHDREFVSLVALDRWVDALKPVPVYRAGSVRTGRRLLESAAGVLGGEVLAAYRSDVVARRSPGHHAVGFGVVMEAARIDERTATLALGAGYANSLLAAAVRLGVIGQQAAQRIAASLHQSIVDAAGRGRELGREEMGAYLPMIDVAGLRQPDLAGRIFAS